MAKLSNFSPKKSFKKVSIHFSFFFFSFFPSGKNSPKKKKKDINGGKLQRLEKEL
jgi:hypothetical protein